MDDLCIVLFHMIKLLNKNVCNDDNDKFDIRNNTYIIY